MFLLNQPHTKWKTSPCFSKAIIAFLTLNLILTGCALRKDPEPEPQEEKESIPEVARKAGRFVVLQAAKTPVKVAAAVGGAARTVSKKVKKEDAEAGESPTAE